MYPILLCMQRTVLQKTIYRSNKFRSVLTRLDERFNALNNYMVRFVPLDK